MVEYTIGQDFEFGTSDTPNVPSFFRRDSSVPLEGAVEPARDAREIFKQTKLWLADLAQYAPNCFSGPEFAEEFMLGGHIHLGGLFNVSEKERTFLDNVLSRVISGVVNLEQLQRRSSSRYGQLCADPGYHRSREEKEHGFEYRALPSPPSVEVIGAYFGLAEFALRTILEARNSKELRAKEIFKRISNFKPPAATYYSGSREEVVRIASWIMKRIQRFMTPRERELTAPVVRLLKNKQIAESRDLLSHHAITKPVNVDNLSVVNITDAEDINRGINMNINEGHVRYSYQTISDRITRDGSTILGVKTQDGQLIAIGAVVNRDTVPEICHVIVARRYRGLGIGKLIMGEAIRLALSTSNRVKIICVEGQRIESILMNQNQTIELDKNATKMSIVFTGKQLRTYYISR